MPSVSWLGLILRLPLLDLGPGNPVGLFPSLCILVVPFRCTHTAQPNPCRIAVVTSLASLVKVGARQHGDCMSWLWREGAQADFIHSLGNFETHGPGRQFYGTFNGKEDETESKGLARGKRVCPAVHEVGGRRVLAWKKGVERKDIKRRLAPAAFFKK